MERSLIPQASAASTEFGNPKSETRNPKQIQKAKREEIQNPRSRRSFEPCLRRISDLFRISDFGFRICRPLPCPNQFLSKLI
jgi:hypothetical protein